jgi:mannose-6-phosphate isomerase-like protein (cupin superfamily)
MDVVIASRDDLPRVIAALGRIGYVHRGDLGVVGREAFEAPQGLPRHHLYVCSADSPELRRHLLFRDYLRAHEEAALDYAALKRDLSERYRDDREAYTDGKSEFVEGVLQQAAEAPVRQPAALPHFDRSVFSGESYLRRVEKPWGWELHWTPADLPYAGKVLHLNAGARISLQLHDAKRESWLLISGRARVVWENSDGVLVETEMEPGLGYSCALGQKHRLVGITDCDIVEVSTPEIGTTWRIEDDYSRPHETPEQRALERGET